MSACARTGMCCENVLLAYSPAELRRSYVAWRDSTQGPGIVQLQEIYLIYPMLEGRCKGKYKTPGGYTRYVYGPCKNLGYPEGKATCTIHENRPKLCSGYPFYEDPQKVQMGTEPKENPGYMRGCGYNADKTVGLAKFELMPLEESEK